MSKHYIIRHKETHAQFFTSRGKKGAWKTVGHAKAAFTTAHQWRGGFTFDEQDVYEIVAVTPADQIRLKAAEDLLDRALSFLDDVHAYDSDIAEAIRAYYRAYD